MSCFCLLASFMGWMFFSQPKEAPIDETPKVVSCGKEPEHFRVEARHIEPKGIGYNQGYTSLEAFLALSKPWNDRWVPFLDVRGHMFNNGKPAANAGLGLRFFPSDRIYGINAYYDYRNTKRQHYNQVSVGLETLGKWIDFRMNGYLPLGRKTSPGYHLKFDEFKGNYAILSEKYEYAFKSANAEIGIHAVQGETFPLYLAGGAYYLDGEGKTAWGGQFRAALNLSKYVRLEGNTSYDKIFNWIGQGQISLVMPLGNRRDLVRKKEPCAQVMTARSRAYQKVDRFEIIPLSSNHRKLKAINPATDEPYLFYFVNNLSSSNGTFESPYSSLATAQDVSGPNDIIYVFPGDLTSNGMDSGIVLQDNQQLLGSANSYKFYSTAGKFKIPAYSSYQPQIANLTGPVVTVGNGNTISGFQIINGAGSGIVQGPALIRNLTVSNNFISGGQNGVDLGNVNGLLLITKNNFLANGAINGVNIQSNNIAYADYRIIANEFDVGGPAVNISMVDDNLVTVRISNNTIVSRGGAINIANSSSAAPGGWNIVNVESNLLLAHDIPFTSVVSNFANTTLNIGYNSFTSSNNDGINVTANNSSTTSLNVYNNRFSTWEDGVEILVNDNSNFNYLISNNIFAVDNLMASEFHFTGNSISQGIVTNNVVLAYNYIGVNFDFEDNSVGSLNMKNNQTQSRITAFILNMAHNSNIDLVLMNNQFHSAEDLGLQFTVADSAVTSAQIVGNSFASAMTAVGSAASISAGTSSQLCLQFDNNLSLPSVYPGGNQPISFTQSGSALFQLEPLQGNIGAILETGTITPVPAGTCQ